MAKNKLNKRESIGADTYGEEQLLLAYRILKPHQSVLKAYLREPVAESDLAAFRNAMRNLLKRIEPAESEEFNKNLVAEFFNQSLYKGNKYMVNTRGRADLAIYSESGQPVVLFEFKGPNEPGMVTKEDLKNKAFYQLILYYIREEVKNRNSEIRHLIITNCLEYFIFDKKDFYQWFARNNRFAQKVLDAEERRETTENIYNTIIKPEVERLEKKIQFQFAYIDLRDFARDIDKESILENRQFTYAYKLLSPTHLLKQSFNSDHNTLNTGFYQELLYIMGVEEIVEDRVHKIKRLKSDRQPYSLVEQAYSKLEDYSRIADESQRFETSLGLVLTWINRVLFLKLLESQLESFNSSEDIKFLNKQHIDDYDALHDLFLKVLAKPIAERSQEMLEQFPNVPYLNSSLFELSQLEETFFPISGIRMGEMNVFAKTVLKDGRGKKISGKKTTLDYLLEFLDAYDFGSERNTDKGLVRQESKTLINASVLGLIFEKINGYKDGSFFTPGYITQYICQETLRKAVVDKFNAAKGWSCADFEELKEHIDFGKREVRTEANKIINSLKICDPAVGSGHFLVSALNELIAIKSELGVLQDRQELPKPIRDYDVRVELDELVISNEDGENYKYDPASPASQRIQETLFEEKRTIIENCLFGVDLNPKSVEICRLRLWIELLKNAYYYKDEAGNRHLQTLPNIDINIKSGDSLLHRFDLNESISQVLRSTGHTISEYRNAVFAYKNAHNKGQKKELNDLINDIKTSLKIGISERDPKRRKLLSYRKELSDLQSQELFGSDWTAKQLAAKRKKEKELSENIQKLDAYIKEIESNKIYLNAFEWRIEFPEVLDNDGNFIGFDCIIGNPPYGTNMDDISYLLKTIYPKTSHGFIDIYKYFFDKSLSLLKEQGLLSYITPSTFLRQPRYQDLRDLLLEYDILTLVDLGENVFDAAVVPTAISFIRKEHNDDNTTLFSDITKEADTQKAIESISYNHIKQHNFQSTANHIFIKDIRLKRDDEFLLEDILNMKDAGINYQRVNVGLSQKGKSDLSERLLYEGEKEDVDDVEYWKGIDINEYYIAESTNRYCRPNIPLRDNERVILNDDYFAISPKLLWRQTASYPICVIDYKGMWFGRSIQAGIISKKFKSLISYEYLCALLNSKYLRKLYENNVKEEGRVFPQVKLQKLKSLPVIIPEDQSPYIDLVKTIIALKSANPDADISVHKNKIDLMVYQLYGLTYDEVKLIDPATPITREEYEC